MAKTNEDTFEILAEALSEGVIVVDKKQTIVVINSAAQEMFGYQKADIQGQKLTVLIPKSYHHDHKGHFEKFFKHSEKRQMGGGRNLYGQKKNGDTFPVEVGLNPFTIYGNTFVMALVIDITERKKVEQTLNHWAKIFDESLNEIYIFEKESLKFVDVNRGAQNNIGYKIEELKQLTPVDIKPDFTEVQFREVLASLLQKKQEKIEFETVHQRKDGSLYPVEVHLQLSTLGDINVFVAIILDITDRKNYTEKLEKTVEKRTKELSIALEKEKEINALKTKFLSLVSHEFKTPLAGIGTSSMLARKYTQTEQQEKRDKHFDTIDNKVKYLNNILNDFLSIERLQSGKVNYKFSTFPLSKVLNEVVYSANLQLKNGQKINYPSNIDEITIDSEEKILELTLANLVNNAIKYSPENTNINIDVQVKDKRLFMEVSDQGIGIPEQEQKFVFNRYFRAENALLSQGTGIGLNIVKGHLENLGGGISFISKENMGSTFTVNLPLTNNR